MAVYESQEELQRRLLETIVRYQDKVARVIETGGRAPNALTVMLRTYPDNQIVERVRLDNADLNIREMPLGYVNMSGGAVYLERMPVRRYQQGLTANNVHVDIRWYSTERRPSFHDIYPTSAFRDCIMDVYPDLGEAVNRLNGPEAPASVAIKRDLAIRKDKLRGDFELVYKNIPIAYGNIQNFILPEEFSYLKELCGRCGLRVS